MLKFDHTSQLQEQGKRYLEAWIERVRPTLIRVWWAVFHAMYGWDKRLGVTWVTYMGNGEKRWKHVHMNVDEVALRRDILALKDAWKWIIILNHASWIFADYLPAFWYLGDDILSETTLYTAGFNLPMNQSEFPEYDFREANPTTIKKKKQLLYELWARILEIEWQGWYLFIVPAWIGKDDGNKPFLPAFNHILWNISPDTPVLSFRTSYDSPVSYGKILLARRWLAEFQTTLESRMSRALDWQSVDKDKRREYYNSLFKKSP